MPQAKHSRLDKSLCQHAYYSATQSLARLACYATSRNLVSIGHGEYYLVAEELFKKDILEAAISVRRLSELTDAITTLKAKTLRVAQRDKTGEIIRNSDSLWNILGNIIHGVNIETLKSTAQAEYLSGINKDIMKAISSTKEIDAAVIIKSDKFPHKMFSSIDFCKALNEALDELNDHMADNGLFVGTAYE